MPRLRDELEAKAKVEEPKSDEKEEGVDSSLAKVKKGRRLNK